MDRDQRTTSDRGKDHMPEPDQTTEPDQNREPARPARPDQQTAPV